LAKNVTSDGANIFETLGLTPTIVGILVATISAAIAIKWLVGYLSRHGVAVFGWYRIALCAFLGIMVLTKTLSITPPHTNEDHATESIPANSATEPTASLDDISSERAEYGDVIKPVLAARPIVP